MQNIAYKSSRIAIINWTVLSLMVVLSILIGIYMEGKFFIIIPIIVALINVAFLVVYYTTPKILIEVHENDLTIYRTFGRKERYSLDKVFSIIYTNYPHGSKDGVMALDIENVQRSIVINNVKNVKSARELLNNAKNDAKNNIDNKE